MNAFEWANASTPQDAVKLLKVPVAAGAADTDPDEIARPMAGGQDLLTTIKAYITRPPRVVNLKTIQGLDKIVLDAKGLRLGATVTLDDLMNHPGVKAQYPGLVEAVHSVATPQIRNLGTVGGNLCQRPRCWYFRLETVVCKKKGGGICYAASGQNKYNAIFDTGPSKIVHPSDLAPMLVALEATVTIMGADGPRTIKLEDFFITPGDDVRKENILKEGEIVTEVQVPPTTARSTYLKFKERESLDFALSSVAAVVELAPDKTVRKARVVLGGVASIPWHVPAVDAFLAGKPLNDQTLASAATMALEGAQPLEFNAYKVPLSKTLVRRALSKLNA
jgi:xanthine dehydrogenase YagS FAD-binding subunit